MGGERTWLLWHRFYQNAHGSARILVAAGGVSRFSTYSGLIGTIIEFIIPVFFFPQSYVSNACHGLVWDVLGESKWLYTVGCYGDKAMEGCSMPRWLECFRSRLRSILMWVLATSSIN